MNTEPFGIAARRRTAPRTRVPLDPTSTRSPSRMSSASASAGQIQSTPAAEGLAEMPPSAPQLPVPPREAS